MFFEWNETIIEYFERAAAYTDFYRDLAALIAPSFKQSDAVLDAGCGLGLLDLELAATVRAITAIDRSPEAIAYLKGAVEQRGFLNINPVNADAETFADAYDVLLLSFFGRPDGGLKRLIGGARRAAIILTHGDSTDTRKSALGEDVKKVFAGEMRSFLNTEGFTCEERAAALEFGQPFLSEADATRYFDLYNRTPKPAHRPALVRTDDPRFPLYYPKQRAVTIFEVDTRR
jgi:SAM-dependent methyltransferase